MRSFVRYACRSQQVSCVSAKAPVAEPEPIVLLSDGHARGVDVGAKAEIHNLIRSLMERLAIVAFCSTHLEELATIYDQGLVLCRHRIGCDSDGGSLNQPAIFEVMNPGSLTKAM